MLPDIWGLDNREKLIVKFNSLNQCVDDGELEYFCGTMARKKELTPLDFFFIGEKFMQQLKTKYGMLLR